MRFARAVLDALRLALARDELGREAPAVGAPAAPPSPGVLHVLLVSREPLGSLPELPGAPHFSLLRSLFAREALPFEPEPPSAPRSRGRLAALFGLEKLDDSP